MYRSFGITMEKYQMKSGSRAKLIAELRVTADGNWALLSSGVSANARTRERKCGRKISLSRNAC
jgi:hypothetical protein